MSKNYIISNTLMSYGGYTFRALSFGRSRRSMMVVKSRLSSFISFTVGWKKIDMSLKLYERIYYLFHDLWLLNKNTLFGISCAIQLLRAKWCTVLHFRTTQLQDSDLTELCTPVQIATGSIRWGI